MRDTWALVVSSGGWFQIINSTSFTLMTSGILAGSLI